MADHPQSAHRRSLARVRPLSDTSRKPLTTNGPPSSSGSPGSQLSPHSHSPTASPDDRDLALAQKIGFGYSLSSSPPRVLSCWRPAVGDNKRRRSPSPEMPNDDKEEVEIVAAYTTSAVAHSWTVRPAPPSTAYRPHIIYLAAVFKAPYIQHIILLPFTLVPMPQVLAITKDFAFSMPLVALEVLRRGFDALKKHIGSRSKTLEDHLANNKSITSDDERWLDDEGNIADEEWALRDLETASEYERGMLRLNAAQKKAVKRLKVF
ncbi:hypothetical protein B0H14DRAFT_3759027 [Mycena olivaceomarginata]|nr:hypothetical protein B0H14DRAFT_3759027 [Mycena olivaceomarginata]